MVWFYLHIYFEFTRNIHLNKILKRAEALMAALARLIIHKDCDRQNQDKTDELKNEDDQHPRRVEFPAAVTNTNEESKDFDGGDDGAEDATH